jgi:hypothetical protein
VGAVAVVVVVEQLAACRGALWVAVGVGGVEVPNIVNIARLTPCELVVSRVLVSKNTQKLEQGKKPGVLVPFQETVTNMATRVQQPLTHHSGIQDVDVDSLTGPCAFEKGVEWQ